MGRNGATAGNGSLARVGRCIDLLDSSDALISCCTDAPAPELGMFSGDYGLNPPHDWEGSIWPPVADGLASPY